MLKFIACWILVVQMLVSTLRGQELVDRAKEGLLQGVTFFHQRVAVNGGYVYQVSADLKYREGEGDAGKFTVWVQPPGTPAVGLALVEAYERTGEDCLIQAALSAGDALVRGQLHSGGWERSIEFDSALRSKHAYRLDGPRRAKAKNYSSFDDDQTQSAIRFLIKLDRALEFKNEKIHEAVEFALRGVLENQFPTGGWGQGFEKLDRSIAYPKVNGNYPMEWSRKHQGQDYWEFYTLNDNALVRVIDTMWLAFEVYGDTRYKQSALEGADFLLLAQMPEPQPAWAQQYNYAMQPIWARKFEPPAISGSESQYVIDSLMDTFVRTGNQKYIATVDKAIRYLESSQLADGRLARFYELKTNRPLYFSKTYELTYSDDDLPTHYGFKVASRLTNLKKRFDELKELTIPQLEVYRFTEEIERREAKPSEEQIKAILDDQSKGGAWIESGKLKYIKNAEHDGKMIHSQTFIRNIELLSRYLGNRSVRTPPNLKGNANSTKH